MVQISLVEAWQRTHLLADRTRVAVAGTPQRREGSRVVAGILLLLDTPRPAQPQHTSAKMGLGKGILRNADGAVRTIGG